MLPSLARLTHCARVGDPLPDGTLEKIRTQICHLCEEPLGNRTGSDLTWPGTGDPFIFTACNHVFHKPCIQKWLKRSNRTCPDCRADISYLTRILRDENPPAPRPGGLFGGAHPHLVRQPRSTPDDPNALRPRPSPFSGGGLFDNPPPRNMAPLPGPDDPYWEEVRQQRSRHGRPLVRMPDSDSPPSRPLNPFAAPTPPSNREERMPESDSPPSRPLNPFRLARQLPQTRRARRIVRQPAPRPEPPNNAHRGPPLQPSEPQPRQSQWRPSPSGPFRWTPGSRRQVMDPFGPTPPRPRLVPGGPVPGLSDNESETSSDDSL